MQTFEHYRLSKITGAVLEQPAKTLPPAYDEWNQLASSLTKLSQENQFREYVLTMPMIPIETTMTYEELRLAHKILTFAASAYIWMKGEKDVPKSLPAQIAVPLVKVSNKLGLPPIMTHQDLVLANCIQIQGGKPPNCIHQPTHHKSWKAFIELGGFVEILFAPALPFIFDAIRAQHPVDEMKIAFCLRAIRHTLERMAESLNLFHEQLDANEFYMEVRPILCGWTRNPIENGLIYEGLDTKILEETDDNLQRWLAVDLKDVDFAKIDSQNPRIVCNGASAAQSICLQSIDALLQVEHTSENKEFFLSMRRYMIPEHQKFLQDLEKHSKIKQIAQGARLSELKCAYNECIQNLDFFREKHMELVHRFIQIPGTRLTAKLQSLEYTGTGGQKLRQFLETVRNGAKSIEY